MSDSACASSYQENVMAQRRQKRRELHNFNHLCHPYPEPSPMQPLLYRQAVKDVFQLRFISKLFEEATGELYN